MKSWKKLLTMLLCFVLVFTLVACGGSDSDKGDDVSEKKHSSKVKDDDEDEKSEERDEKEEGAKGQNEVAIEGPEATPVPEAPPEPTKAPVADSRLSEKEIANLKEDVQLFIVTFAGVPDENIAELEQTLKIFPWGESAELKAEDTAHRIATGKIVVEYVNDIVAAGRSGDPESLFQSETWGKMQAGYADILSTSGSDEDKELNDMKQVLEGTILYELNGVSVVLKSLEKNEWGGADLVVTLINDNSDYRQASIIDMDLICNGFHMAYSIGGSDVLSGSSEDYEFICELHDYDEYLFVLGESYDSMPITGFTVDTRMEIGGEVYQQTKEIGSQVDITDVLGDVVATITEGCMYEVRLKKATLGYLVSAYALKAIDATVLSTELYIESKNSGDVAMDVYGAGDAETDGCVYAMLVTTGLEDMHRLGEIPADEEVKVVLRMDLFYSVLDMLNAEFVISE